MGAARADRGRGDLPVRDLRPPETAGRVTAGRIELVTCTCGCTFTRAEGHVCEGQQEHRGGRDWPDPRGLLALGIGLLIGLLLTAFFAYVYVRYPNT